MLRCSCAFQMGASEVIRVHTATPSPIANAPDNKTALHIASDILGNTLPLGPGQQSNALRLNRDQAAQFLRRLGYPIHANRLAKLAVHGGGTPYMKWGRRVVYCPLKLLEWAKGRESNARSHTSEADLPEPAV